MKDEKQILNKIIEGGFISPVYQPVISLTEGHIFGYEAVSKITVKELKMEIGQIFRQADKLGKAWELEVICRTKALKNFTPINREKKLFLKVNPNVINDDEFKEGFTRERLSEYGLDFNNIIFEITERTAIYDKNIFFDSILHYRKQKYEIAIDDVGAGYSGLNTIAAIRPNYVKLDKNLIKDIDKDETKQFLCKAMVDFCKNSNIIVLAKGIETVEELKTLIKLNVDLGQGYFFGIPQEFLIDIEPEKSEMIKLFHTKKYIEKTRGTTYPIIGYLSKKGICFHPDEKINNIFDNVKANPIITDFTIVEDDIAVGFMSRAELNELLGGQYGYSLHTGREMRQFIKDDFLRVNYNMPVDQVSRLAMQRNFKFLYNPVVVEKDGKYSGIVTVKDLLDSCTKVDIEIAIHSNPLTGLPGNLLIEKEISSRIFGEQPYCILYFDLDNFKAYNDAYGFQNGDKLLGFTAKTMKKHAVKNEFIGHIGGDDFITVCDYHDCEDFCKAIIAEFSLSINSFYREEDVKNGYFISRNRHGVKDNFPLASISIAGISNKSKIYQNIDEFSNDIAKLKKKCKKHQGSYYEII